MNNEVIEKVEVSFSDIESLARDVVSPDFTEVDKLIDNISKNVDKLTGQTLRDYLINLSIYSYKLASIRDKADVKSDIALAVKKEKYAVSHNETEGTVAKKDNTALLLTSDETAVNLLYNLISDLYKSKVDEVHRIIDTLKVILMTKNQEMKMTMTGAENI